MIAMPRFVPSLPPYSRGNGVAVVAGGVGAAARLGEQRLPLAAREAAALPVGARVLAAVIEEADVVVLRARAA